jgi:hypothetical protein
LEGISAPTSYSTPSTEQAIATGDFTSTIKEDKQPHKILKIFLELVTFQEFLCTSTQEYAHDSQYNKTLHFWFSIL